MSSSAATTTTSAGLSKALSNDPPTEPELRMDGVLSNVLHGLGVDGRKQMTHRFDTMGNVSKMAQESVEEMLPVKGAWAQLVLFGSSALDAPLTDSDIDVLIMVPHTVDRVGMLDRLATRLKRRGCAVTKVYDTMVPVIRFMYNGIDFDATVACLDMARPPTDKQLLDVDIFSRVTQATRKSLNGVRTALEILTVIPNLDVFRTALIAVKHWAIQRKVYGNLYCFPSGVGFAVLVAWICTLFPKAVASSVVRKFFHVCLRWFKRPTKVLPIKIFTESEKLNGLRVKGLMDPWNSKTNGDDILPVLNPAFPYTNTCFCVSRCSVDVLLDELARGEAILSTERATSGDTTTMAVVWDRLFLPYDLGDGTPQFVVVSSLRDPRKVSDEEFASWVGFLECRVKYLMYSLEAASIDYRPIPGSFPDTDTAAGQSGVKFMIGLKSATVTLAQLKEPIEIFYFAFKKYMDKRAHPRSIALPSVTIVDAAQLEEVQPLKTRRLER